MQLIKKAYAKINLTLDILGKRQDGYHNIISIMQSVSLYDKLTISKAEKGIDVTWNAAQPCDTNNTVYRAANLVFSEYSINGGLSVFIEKNIPFSAGLGGGSADAAAVIEGINELYGLNISKKDLLLLGAEIGADVPFCLTKGAAIAEGIGERILTFPGSITGYVVLVKPWISISTKEAFAKIDVEKLVRRFDTNSATQAIKAGDFRNLGLNLYNAFEPVTFSEYPIIAEIKKKMITRGANGALMSGSGPTVYGIFENKALAENAYNYFINSYNRAAPINAFVCEFYYPPCYSQTGGIR